MKSFFRHIKSQLMNSFLFPLCLFLCIVGFIATVRDNPLITARAEKSEYPEKVETELGNIVKEQLKELNLEDLQSYFSTLNGFTDQTVSERLIAYIKGEKFDYKNFGENILIILFEKIEQILPSFLSIIIIALLTSLIATLRGGALVGTSLEMIFLISFATTLIPLISILTEGIKGAFNGVREMQAQMQLIYPLMLTLMAASGGTLSAAIAKPTVAFFSTSIVSLISTIVFPLTITIIAFSMAGKLSKELKIGTFTAFFKSINKWIIGISISVFGLFFTIQGITAATYDGVVRRAAKYAIGNGIPIVGGFLSGGFDLAIAGSILIKNSLGNMGIFLMVSVLFEPLLLLIAINLMLRLTSAVAQPFGDSRIADFLGETADNLNFCTAGLLFTAFLYFLSIVLMICASEALL